MERKIDNRQCNISHTPDRDSIGTAGRSQSSQGWIRIGGLRLEGPLSSRGVPHSAANGRMYVVTSTKKIKKRGNIKDHIRPDQFKSGRVRSCRVRLGWMR